jgi:putative DNA primase/helicase
MTTPLSQQDVEQQFSDWLSARGYGDHEIPADSEWYNFSLPDDKPGKRHGSAKLNYGGDEIDGVYKDWRCQDDLKVWRPTNGAAPEFTDEEKRVAAEAKSKRDAKAKADREKATQAALKVYNSLPDAKPDHPYLKSRGIEYVEHIKFDKKDKSLVVPIHNARTDKLQTIQKIYPDGGKLFFGGAAKAGGYFMPRWLTIDRPSTKYKKSKEPIIICEGIATGVSIYVSTDFAYWVVCALDSGNLRGIAEAIRDRFPLRSIIIAADNDTETEGNPGVSAATKTALAIGWNCKLAVPPPGDFNDLLRAQGGEAVKKIIDAAVEPPRPSKDDLGPKPDADEKLKKNADATLQVEIARLAALSLLHYEQQRKAAAIGLSIRVSVLDDMVEAARPPGSGGVGQGTPLNIVEIVPWSDPVEGEKLITDLVKAIRSHVILTEEQALAVALWCVHTHAFEFADHSARLHVASPAKRCGKTTLLGIIAELVPKKLGTENITMAALFRTIEMVQPTLLIDEADTFLKDNDDIRGMLNAGHGRGGQVIRTVGEDFEPRAFSVWAPVVIAGIGNLPTTLEDRSITISLRRRLKNETIERLRRDRVHLSVLGRRIARWVADNLNALADADPKLPEKLGDRQQDNWRPLIAIADAISAAFGEWARNAALKISEEETDDESFSIMALTDVADIFEANKVERMTSASLTNTLVNMKDRPWPEFRYGKELTQNGLARLLKPFKIHAKKIRFDSETFRGYEVEPIREAKLRYIDDDDTAEEEKDA